MTKKVKKNAQPGKSVEPIMTAVQKLEKYLLENSLSVGVQLVHKQMWRKKLVVYVCKLLGIDIVPYVYPIIKK